MSTSLPPSPLSHRSRINFEVLGKMSHTPSRLALVRCACVEFPTRFRKNGKRLLDKQFSCISDLDFIHHLRGSFKITCRKRSCLRTNKRIRAPWTEDKPDKPFFIVSPPSSIKCVTMFLICVRLFVLLYNHCYHPYYYHNYYYYYILLHTPAIRIHAYAADTVLSGIPIHDQHLTKLLAAKEQKCCLDWDRNLAGVCPKLSGS